MQNQDFDSVFKNKLETFEMPPDDASWNTINQQMNTKRWLKRSAYISTIVVFISLLGYFFTKEKAPVKKQSIDSTELNQNPVPSLEEKSTPNESTINEIQNKPKTTSPSSVTTKQEREIVPLEQTLTPATPAKDTVSTTTTTTTPKTDTVAAPKVVVVKKKNLYILYNKIQ